MEAQARRRLEAASLIVARRFTAAALALALALPASAAAAATFDELKAQGAPAVLAESDRLSTGYDTQQWVVKMTVKPADSEAKSLRMQIWQKGSKRLVRFLEPGEVKGMSMLSTGAKIMYVYSPQTDNVRRIAASARRQTMLGSNLTYTDMQSAPLGELYDAAFGADEAAYAWLELTPKAGAEVAWTKLRVRVEKKTKMAQKIEYFDGTLKRIEERSKHESWDGTPTYRRIQMKTLADGLVTTLDVEKQTINGDIADTLFKKRNLVRGN